MSKLIQVSEASDLEKAKCKEFVFQCTLFLLCALNSVASAHASRVVSLFNAATTKEGRDNNNISQDYMKTSKGLSAVVNATSNCIKKHDKRFLETITNENHAYVEDRYADLLDFTDEKIKPFVDAIHQCIYITLDAEFPTLQDKRFLTELFVATEMAVFNEMMFDLIADGSYTFMKKNARFSMLRMHKLNDQLVKILRFMNVRTEDDKIINMNITEILFSKPAVKILDDLSLFLLSSEFTDKVQQNINNVDPQFRKASKSIVSAFADITLPMVAYQQRYTNFKYEKFIEKYIA